MLEESMKSNDGANVPRKLFSALSSREISVWVFAIHLDDQVTEVHISFWILMWILIAEKFWKSLHFQLMNDIKVEPLSATWDNESLFLILLFNLPNFRNFLPVHLFICLVLSLWLFNHIFLWALGLWQIWHLIDIIMSFYFWRLKNHWTPHSDWSFLWC